MPPTLALLIGLALIAWMFARDLRWRQLPSRALWITAFWLALASSRPMSFWLAQVGIGGNQTSHLEGSSVNVVFNGSLFFLAILVLHRRRFKWGQFVLANKALCAMYAFYFCSMLWSPFPLPTARGVVQDFGCVLIGLIFLTEKDPAAALQVVFVRVSYILLSLSVVFMKYFPEIGVRVSVVGDGRLMSGVADHKNSLGQMAMVFSLVLIWDLMETWKHETASRTTPERWARLMNLGIGLHVLFVSRSATAWLCFLIGLVLLFQSRRLARMRNARRAIMVVLLTMALVASLEVSFGISGRVSEAMGRGGGMSGRDDIWRAVLMHARPSLIGYGFHGFWATSDGEAVWRETQTNQLFQSHNGYVETFVTGGYVGLCLLGVLLLASGHSAVDKVVRGEPIGRLAVVFWPLLLLTNVTEAGFFQIGPLWFTTLLVVIQRGGRIPVRSGAPEGRDRPRAVASPFSERHLRPKPPVDTARPVHAQPSPRIRWESRWRVQAVPTTIVSSS